MCEDCGEEALALVTAVRRLLEDVVVFEGPAATLPPAPCEPEPEAPPGGMLQRGGSRADGPAFRGGSVAGADPAAALEDLRAEVDACTRCGLARSRHRTVVGAGDPEAAILFVGEAPGEEEDRRGEPFVGAAGELLTRIIRAMGLTREDVYIANILKCRPPGNRDPREDEIGACLPYLEKQIGILHPRVICTLGRIAAQALLGTDSPLGRLRGRPHEYAGIPVVCTYHPAALLRNAQYKRPTWEDVKRVRALYDGVEL